VTPASPRPRRPGPQKIPRPPAARAGGPPPWPEWLTPEERPVITVDDVRRAVKDLPDLEPYLGPPVKGEAGVLAAVFEEDGEARIILTRRTEWLRSHSHQVSFPGGRAEEGEEPADAALREAFEEIGLDPSSVEIVGRLTRLATITNPQGSIHPFVGVLPRRPVYDPNPDEVDRVFDIPIVDLMEAGAFKEEIWGIADSGVERSIFFFELDDDTIWGATARMLYELLTLLTARRD
jgi:8-oxo-dGTP pyrophosphatase MutT (NUDIX family)